MGLLQSIPPFVYIALVAFGVVLGTVAYLILLERKVASWVQDRIGPNRVGPRGLLQPIADGLKFFLKEDYRPGGVDKVLFTVAPAVMMLVVIVALAVIPWGGTYRGTRQITIPAGEDVLAAANASIPMNASLVGLPQAVNPTTYAVTYQYAFQIADLNIGVLFLIAVLSLAVYGVVVGGWASNNKYSFLGGLRATAQMISYEIPLGLSLLTIVLMSGTLELNQIVDRQAHYWAGFIPAWNVFSQPLAFLMFLVCIHAEANRAPFDLAEAEQELVGGYHTEYSSMRFALFFLAEYAEMIATSAVCVALFFGGWHFWGLNGSVDPANPSVTSSIGLILLRCLVYFVKIVVVIFVFMWVRWSLPRFRFDQLMMVAWRAMIPLALAMVLVTAVVLYFVGPQDETFKLGRGISGWTAVVLLIVNLIVLGAAMLISRMLPPPPETNRRLRIEDSRFTKTPLPAGTTA
ncbi:MAG: NADH-quinone oxidoreductase subunit NuoH [Bacillota bacterium]